jgi:hypothetical protein
MFGSVGACCPGSIEGAVWAGGKAYGSNGWGAPNVTPGAAACGFVGNQGVVLVGAPGVVHVGAVALGGGAYVGGAMGWVVGGGKA